MAKKRTTKTTKTTIDDSRIIKLRELGFKLEEAKEECAAARDKLRKLLSEYSDIVDTFEFAAEDLVLAKDYIESAVERMSELV